MREYNFRVWDDEFKKYLTFEDLCEYSVGDVFDNDNFNGVIEQYTGLKDTASKEIYEGHIIIDKFNETSFEVIFHDGGYRKKYKNWTEYIYPLLTSSEIKLMGYNIIGNINQNQDLLK